jgi:spore germination protein (amino acid permease)
MYLLTHLGLIFFLYPGDVIASTESGHWLPIMIGEIVHFIVIIMYMKGLSLFPNEDIIQIYHKKVGKWPSLLFLLPISFYFFMIIIITVRTYSEIISIILLSNTPLWAVLALILIVSFTLAAQGVEAIFRTGVLLAFLFIPLVIFILGISFQNVDWYYVFPLLNKNLSFFTTSHFLKSFFAFGGGFLFLGFIQPKLSYKRKYVVFMAIALIPCFIISVYIPILTFGQATASTFVFPFVVAVDAVNINWLMFDRVTVFFLMSLITFIMLFLALVIWKMLKIINFYIPSIKRTYLLLFFIIAFFIICLLIPNWEDAERFFKWNTALRFYVMLVIPFSIYFLGIRNRKRIHNENI